MFAAARKLDPITHDAIVPSGLIMPPLSGPCPSAPVIIEGLPAAHMGCTVICSGAVVAGAVHPPLPIPPAPPPPVISGSVGVFIHSMPASRWFPSGDVAACGAFLGDPKLLPTRTVFIGGTTTSMRPVTTSTSGGLLGAVVGGILGAVGGAVAGFIAGGPLGAIVGGVAGAVVGAAVGHSLTANEVTHYGDSITIEGTPEFRAKVVRDLRIIESTPSGRRLLASMEASGKTARIHFDNDGWAWTDPPPGSQANPPGYLRTDGKPGAKANTEIGYDPDATSYSGTTPSIYDTAAWAQPPNAPSDSVLFHEMTHADDMMHGRMDGNNGVNTGPRAGNPVPNYEIRAAGLGPYANESYSENTYRRDRNLLPRTFY